MGVTNAERQKLWRERHKDHVRVPVEVRSSLMWLRPRSPPSAPGLQSWRAPRTACGCWPRYRLASR